MKTNEISGARLKAKVRRDRRLRHGLYSNAVKYYRILDREVRNSEIPTPELFNLLGMSLVTALHRVAEATDVTDRESRARYSTFLSSVQETRAILGEEGMKNFRNLIARQD